MSQPEVIVENNSPHTIWVIIAEDQKNVIETKTRIVRETDFETYFKLVVEGKVASPIKGEVSGKESGEFKLRLKQYYEENKEAKYEWSEFIAPGELEIPPGNQGRWARKADSPIYYVTIRTMGRIFPATSIGRQDAILTLNPNGKLADPIQQKKEITANSPVYLQRQGEENFVGDPQTSAYNWDAGTFGNAGGSHIFEGDNGEITEGILVRIVSRSKTLVDKSYKYLYSSDIGNTYYDKKRKSPTRNGKKQLWKIAKTTHRDNSSGPKLHYGDRVKISNGNWPKANLGVNGKWLQCVNDDQTIWILRAEARI